MELLQPREGYRFTTDSLALANAVQIASSESLLDLCSGCGVIPIFIGVRSPFRSAIAVELDEELACFARLNISRYQLDEKIHVLQADVRKLTSEAFKDLPPSFRPAYFDVITGNPPYWPTGQGRLNPDFRKALARHETSLTLCELVRAARQLLKPGGRFYLTHLDARRSEILAELAGRGLRCVRIETVPGQKARRILLEATLGSASL